MARMDVAVPMGVAGATLAPFLPIEDLARFQFLNSWSMSAVDGSVAWRQSVCHALPSFELADALFDEPRCKEFLACLPLLLRAAVATGTTVPLSQLTEVQKLSKLLKVAERAAAAHLAGGGRLARIFVAHLGFPAGAVSKALDAALVPAPGPTAEACLGVPAVLPPRQVDAHGAELRLNFALQGGKLFVSARDGGADHRAREVIPSNFNAPHQQTFGTNASTIPLMLDIASAIPSLTLNYKGVQVTPNKTWQEATSGIFAFTRGKAAAVSALESGVPCVMLVRDATAVSPAHHIAHALHLDTVKHCGR